MDIKLPDGHVIANVPEGTTQRQLLDRLLQAKHPSAQSLLDKVSQETALEGMSGLDKFNAGAGLAFTNLGRAAKQMVGADSDYQANKDADKALTRTGAGLAGNIAGNVAALAPLSVIPGANTVAGAGAIGGITAAFQPAEGDVDRLKNMGLGAALGGATQAVARYPVEILDALKGVGRGLKSTVEPFYEEGRKQILGRALRTATEGNPDVATRLANAAEIVPGSKPTAAQVGGSGGLAALERSASAVNPEAYATRAAQQNEARAAELADLSGTGGQRDFYAASRGQAADQLYEEAYKKGVDLSQLTPGRKGEITKLLQRPAIQEALESARTLAANEGVKLSDPAGSVKGLDYLKRALDDKIGKANGNEQRVLTDLKNRLLTTIDTLSPEYAAARTTFREMSKPINQMDVAQAVSDKAVNKLTGALNPQSFARALSDDTAASATGFGKATLENTLEPSQLSRLQAIKQDLANSVFARDAGRGSGSDTVQKLAMTNMMQRSGLPEGVINLPVLGRAGSWAYAHADERMKKQLAEALLNPQEASILLSKAGPAPLAGATNPQIGERAAALSRALLLPSLPYALTPSN